MRTASSDFKRTVWSTPQLSRNGRFQYPRSPFKKSEIRGEGKIRKILESPKAMASATSPVGFVGVGIMGEGMAMNLAKGGKTLVVWNRSKGKCDPLLAAYPGQTIVVDTPQEVVARCDTTFCMLSTLEASQAVFPAMLEAVVPGKGIVDCATLTPEYMQGMEQQV